MEMHSASCSSERGKAEGTSSLSPPAMIFVEDVHRRQELHLISKGFRPCWCTDRFFSLMWNVRKGEKRW